MSLFRDARLVGWRSVAPVRTNRLDPRGEVRHVGARRRGRFCRTRHVHEETGAVFPTRCPHRAPRSPPCAPIPGNSSHASFAIARTRAIADGSVAPTTRPIRARARRRDDLARHALVHRVAVPRPCILHALRLRVRGAREHEQIERRVFEERRERADAEVRAHRQRVGTELRRRDAVGRVRRADVASFRVEQARNVRRERLQEHLEGVHPRRAVRLEEGRVGLERRRVRVRGLHHPHARGEQLLGAEHARIEAHADVTTDRRGTRRDPRKEAHAGLPSTAASSAIRTYIPFSTCRKYAARRSSSTASSISPTRGKGCIMQLFPFIRAHRRDVDPIAALRLRVLVLGRGQADDAAMDAFNEPPRN